MNRDTKVKEQHQHVWLDHLDFSAMVENSIYLGDHIQLHNTSILSTKHMICTIREEIEIVLHPINMNREDGFHLSKLWKHIFSLKNHGKPPSQDSLR